MLLTFVKNQNYIPIKTKTLTTMLLAAALAAGTVCCGDSSKPGGAKEPEKAFQKLVSAEKALSDKAFQKLVSAEKALSEEDILIANSVGITQVCCNSPEVTNESNKSTVKIQLERI